MFERPSFEKKSNEDFVIGTEAAITLEGGDDVSGTVAFFESQADGAIQQLLLVDEAKHERMFFTRMAVGMKECWSMKLVMRMMT
jgi:hypothetical protein